MLVRPTLLQPFKSRQAFLENYLAQGTLGGLFFPGNTHLNTGDIVDVEIVFVDEQMVFHTRGLVRWKRLTVQRQLPAGIGVEFLPSEGRTRDLMLEFAKGRIVRPIQRRQRRYSVLMDVECRIGKTNVQLQTDNFSRDGAFLLGDATPALGSEIDLSIRTNDAGALRVQSEVVWHQLNVQPGFGVRFVSPNEMVQRQIDGLIERIRIQIATRYGIKLP